jgi:hypothetical protein
LYLFFQGDFENSKGQTRGKQRHVGRDVQKSVEEDVIIFNCFVVEKKNK